MFNSKKTEGTINMVKNIVILLIFLFICFFILKNSSNKVKEQSTSVTELVRGKS